LKVLRVSYALNSRVLGSILRNQINGGLSDLNLNYGKITNPSKITSHRNLYKHPQ
jgi:hypothetical protein